MSTPKVNTVCFVLVFIFLFSTTLFAWPFGEKKASPAKNASSGQQSVVSKTSVPAAGTQVRAAAQSQPQQGNDNFFSADDEEEEAEPVVPELPLIPKVPTLPQIPKVSPVANVSAGSLDKKLISPAQTASPIYQDPEIAKIQTQIREIMKINESLKSGFTDQAAEIQKISEQAKIHEKILTDLEKTKEMTQKANAENYLNREKIKLIQKETQQNQNYLNDLKKKTQVAVPNSSEPASLTAESAKQG